jgi:soluble lytic murein transglycosylase-like protein
MNEIIAAIILALISVESGGNPVALNDFKNGTPQAVGILQIHPEALAEANRLEAIEARREHRLARTWKLLDRFDIYASAEMAAVTLRHHYRRGITDPVALGGLWRNPKGDAPEKYLKKIRKALQERKNRP